MICCGNTGGYVSYLQVASGQSRPKSVGLGGSQEEGTDDSRSGVFCHPTKGQFLTYMFEVRKLLLFYQVHG